MPCNINVLIAEDDQLNRMMLEKLLHKFNTDCVMAKDGREAVELFGKTKCDAVFLDVNMPVYSGPECAAMIRKSCAGQGKTPPLLVCISADGDFSTDNTFDYFLEKPFNIEKIKLLLDSISKCKCDDEPYDFKKACEIIGLDEETMLMLMDEFINVFDEEMVNLKNALIENNSDNITHVAHKMKGAAANMQANPLKNYCSEMQSADKTDHDAMNILYSRIYCSYCFFKQQLNR